MSGLILLDKPWPEGQSENRHFPGISVALVLSDHCTTCEAVPLWVHSGVASPFLPIDGVPGGGSTYHYRDVMPVPVI
jgi:hypothetical protein